MRGGASLARLALVAAGLIILAAGPAQAAGLKKGYAMCRDQKSLQRLLSASVAKDEKTFGGLMGGPCRATRGNERIRLEARQKTMARVTLKGRRQPWWTVIEALR